MVSTEIIDRIAFVTMQNGKHFNCLSEEMCNALSEAIEEAYKAECVGIVIKAEVNKGVWSAGHDIHELPLDGRDPLAYDVLSISAIKRQFRILSRAATVLSSEKFEQINAYRTKVYCGEDYKEGITSFFEKRPPEYKGKASDLD